jgi:hemolysin activation/secretion protein
MSGSPKRWEFLFSFGLVAFLSILLSPSNARAGIPTIQSSSTFAVGQFKVVGNTVLSAADLNSITQLIAQKPVTFIALNQVADAITQLYIQRGFTTSKVVLLPQTFKNNGTVTLHAIEGWLGEIQVTGTQQLQPSYIKSRLRLAAGSPLNLPQLEAQIRLLNADPMLEQVETQLRAGTKPGESILMVKVQEADRYSKTFSTNNYGSSDGLPEKTRVSANYRNLMGLGDELSISSSLGPPQNNLNEHHAAQNYEVSYRIPVNARDGAVQLQTSLDDHLIGDSDFAELGLRSRDEVYALTFRQPLVRSFRQEFALSLGFSAQKSQTFLFNDVPYPFGNSADANGITQTRVLQFGQDYTRRDALGVWNVGSSLNVGLGILEATEHSGPVPDGQFLSWQLQGQRVQQLGHGHLLIAQGTLQLSPDSLLSSQQFNLGGGQSVRGFRQNVRSGDNGWRFSVEGRFSVVKSARQRSILQLAPFFDAGAVWNAPQNPKGAVNQGFLAGAGLGLLWQPSQSLDIRLDYGIPLVNLSDRTGGLQDSGLYFSVTSR